MEEEPEPEDRQENCDGYTLTRSGTVTEMEIDDAGPREPLSRLGFRRAGMRERERVREEIRGRSRAHRIGIVVCTISTTDRRQRRKFRRTQAPQAQGCRERQEALEGWSLLGPLGHTCCHH